MIGNHESSQRSNPQSCSGHPRVADNGCPLDWGMSGYIPIFPNL